MCHRVRTDDPKRMKEGAVLNLIVNIGGKPDAERFLRSNTRHREVSHDESWCVLLPATAGMNMVQLACCLWIRQVSDGRTGGL